MGVREILCTRRGRGSDEQEERARDGPSAAEQGCEAWFISPDRKSGVRRMRNIKEYRGPGKAGLTVKKFKNYRTNSGQITIYWGQRPDVHHILWKTEVR